MILILDFKIIAVTSRTVTIELQNDNVFTNEKNFNLYINGEKICEFNNNVYTINGLIPDTKYIIHIENGNLKGCEVEVKTCHESRTLNVRDFGAIGDGENNDTLAIQTAIYCCPKDGTVLIPEGRYYIQPLFLKSNITIYIQRGAALVGAKDRKEYSILPQKYELGSWEGKYEDAYASLINGINIENVKIIGEGEIDGNASFDTWWKDAKIKRGAWRPKILYFKNCNDVHVEGIKLKNSPSWTIHPLNSCNLKFVNLYIENPMDSPNTDGLNPESCKDVEIVGVKFSVGDDCIAIKSGRRNFEKLYLGPSENITIRNCYMEFGHGAVTIGSEMSGGVRNVNIEKCIFNKTDRGLRIKTRRGRGGLIDDISIENIFMNNVKTPFTINSYYSCDRQNYSQIVWSKEKMPVDEFTPIIGKIFIKNVKCINSSVAAAYVYGLAEKKIEKIHIEDVYVSFNNDSTEDYAEMMDFIEPMCRFGFYLNNIETLFINNVKVDNFSEGPFIFSNIDNLIFGVEQNE